jgi:5-methylcytosine-specific restriction enzyme A
MPTKPKTFRPAGAPSKQEQRRAFDKRRQASQDYRKWYCLKKWRDIRDYLLRRNPLCPECSARGLVVPGTDIDHIIPHKGDKALFWDCKNLQVLCHECHARKTGQGL